MKNLSFDHVHYRTSDLDKSRKFYVEIMEGIELPSEELGGNLNLHFSLGGVSLLFVYSDAPNVASPQPSDDYPSVKYGAFHIAFLVDDCVEATNYYCGRGAEIVPKKGPTQVSDNIIASFLQAPDGMTLELKQIITPT
jgi:catechol 2,3-dioxygenase-like lactoylglutathione lyase family enzyme